SFRDWGRDCWCPPGEANTCTKRFGWNFKGMPEGYDHKYVYSHIGYNMKATDMQAALGVSQLDKVDDFVAKRRENFRLISDALIKEGIEEHFHIAQPTPGSDPSWFGLPLTLRDGSPLKRLSVTQFLEERKLGTRLLFAGNILKQPGFKDINHRMSGTLDITDKVMKDTFWIGVWPGIDAQRREYMVSVFKDMVQHFLK
ncbi:DegT/DnrJ/EryC1/StrS family aminotransferase, partial [Rhodospirillales bacterium]|nr:DegT/DnrJ/EryC1/StrS family aminotransferase [Rhodospirillales bacterium]